MPSSLSDNSGVVPDTMSSPEPAGQFSFVLTPEEIELLLGGQPVFTLWAMNSSEGHGDGRVRL
jgi:hypothetical protein